MVHVIPIDCSGTALGLPKDFGGVLIVFELECWR